MHVVVPFRAWRYCSLHAEGLGPEPGGLREVVGPAVDDESRKLAPVHGRSPLHFADRQLHVYVTTCIFRRPRVGHVAEAEAFVETNRVPEPAVRLEHDRNDAPFPGPALAVGAEQFADAATLVRGGDGHFCKLEAPFADGNQGDGADDRCAVQREEDHAALADDRALGIVEHLAIRRLHLEQPLDPVEVELAEVVRVFGPELDDGDAAHPAPPFRHSRASRPKKAVSWISPATFQRSRSSPSRLNPRFSTTRSEFPLRGSMSASSRRSFMGPNA